jgi:hypothetical protein
MSVRNLPAPHFPATAFLAATAFANLLHSVRSGALLLALFLTKPWCSKQSAKANRSARWAPSNIYFRPTMANASAAVSESSGR